MGDGIGANPRVERVEEEVSIPIGMFVVGVGEGESGSFLDRPKPSCLLVVPLSVGFPSRHSQISMMKVRYRSNSSSIL